MLARSWWKCHDCGWGARVNHGRHLEVHHLHYDSLGREQPEDLVVLCNVCHGKRHGLPEPPAAEHISTIIARLFQPDHRSIAS